MNPPLEEWVDDDPGSDLLWFEFDEFKDPDGLIPGTFYLTPFWIPTDAGF